MTTLYQYRTLDLAALRRVWSRRVAECREEGKTVQMGVYCCPASVADPEHCPDHPWETVALPLGELLDCFGLSLDEVQPGGVERLTAATAADHFAASHALPARVV